ncbi:MAG: Sulfite exporter TauE/SafE/YfcA and related permease [Thermodesulfobacteria bacterium]|nr:sulfite exporter TauE/SafE family protein [Thermodesulfobacteriota bacterium]MCU4137482.1 Sulfite exporter TauE/SafE/YfcA and related permease [Thermodesulfobacteriota bacterium]
MLNLIIVSFLIFIVATIMTMVGKGGGNFYVVILTMANIPMHEAATTGQFILFSASVAAMIIFQKNKSVSWMLAILIGTFTGLSALAGGYFSHLFSGFSLKLIFAVMLFIAGVLMLIPISENKTSIKNKRFGIISIKSGNKIYNVNLGVALPITLLTGFASGMVGVSGGSFLVPLMVLACGIPMHIAVGTASILIAATAFMGFMGHAIHGDFNPHYAIPLACVTILGGIIGGKFSLKSKPKNLKKLFAYTNWIAALFMIFNAFHTKGII